MATRKKKTTQKAPQNKAKSGRKTNGQFKKGVSGNPGGRPAGVSEVKKLALEACPRAIAKLIEIMDDPTASQKDAIAAANSILDRGIGKPKPQTEGDTQGAREIVLRFHNGPTSSTGSV